MAFAQRHGAAAAELQDALGEQIDRLADPNDRVRLESYLRLVSIAKTETNMPDLSLRWAEEVGMAELSVIGMIMESAATMGDAFRQLQRYGRLAIDSGADAGPAIGVRRDGGRLFIEYSGSVPEAALDIVETAFVHLVCGPRRFLTRPHVLSVYLTRAPPLHRATYERIFRCPINFGAPRNAMELDPDVAARPIARHDAALNGTLTGHADAMLARLDHHQSWRLRVEQVLNARLREGAPDSTSVAHSLGVSRQTLFRRLKAEGTSFALVLDELRWRLAQLHLRDGQRAVVETAFLLGFTEAASFTRAFKRWTGSTPQAFVRARPLASDGAKCIAPRSQHRPCITR
jgi:AraC-like DNA-binding protein